MWILAWGKNFWSKEISILGATLLDLLTKYKGDDEFEVALLTDAKMEFLRFVNLSLEQDDISSVLDELTNNPLTIKEFRDKINLITESFLKSGKNIYPWK